jgi:hypothetical protein
MASLIYPKLIELLNAGTLDWSSDTIRIMLLDDTATYNRAHDFVDDIVADELSGGSYARQTLGTKTSADNGTTRWNWDAADPVFTAVAGSQTVGSAVVYKFITDDASSPLLAYLDGTNIATNGGDVTVTFPANGIFSIIYSA